MPTWDIVFYMVIWEPRLLPFCGSTSSKISKSSASNQHMGKVWKRHSPILSSSATWQEHRPF